jgi:hypothetical protein
MKKDSANEVLIQDADRDLAQSSESRNRDTKSFAHQLRALGQALEKFSFSAFELELCSGGYLVTGKLNPVENVKFSFSRFARELLRGFSGRPALTTDSKVGLRFSPEEIEHFDLRGQIKRQDSGKMPDPYSISQILRGAGSYLDRREVTSLVSISLKGKWLSLRYQTATGRLEQAQQDLEYFYDYWVKMYLRRSNRMKPPALSDPTVVVSWHDIRTRVVSTT